ncbi:hypothetical protein [Streptomyces sp. NPDC048269]|uniref:hypothetical protein n=1 Tax=Streptomyces sp. NPDC048269 TaxID=3155753 RepID=UPI003444945E
MRPIIACLLSGSLCLGVSACASAGERTRAAQAAATAFEGALADGDTRLACAALAPGTREELEQDAPCTAALRSLKLTPATGRARESMVYGSQARVVYADDSVFLALFPEGWRITAAGCVPRQGRPFRCELKGD